MNLKEYDALDEGERSLVDWQYHATGHFFNALWEAISRADTGNLGRLEKAFPLHIKAYRNYANTKYWWQSIQEKLGMRNKKK